MVLGPRGIVRSTRMQFIFLFLSILHLAASARLFLEGKEYIVSDLIADNGRTKVWKAVDIYNNPYAIKQVPVGDEIMHGYLREIGILHSLSDKSRVIKLVDWSRKMNDLYLIFEYGEIDLWNFMQSKFLPIDLRGIWLQMLLAVRQLHEASVVHFDIKPDNFVFVDHRLKIIDFDLSSMVPAHDPYLHRKQAYVGTRPYLSPEAIKPVNPSKGVHKVGKEADIWALGVILYEMVYGKPPFSDLEEQNLDLSCIPDPNCAINYPAPPYKMFEKYIPIIKMCLNRNPKLRPTVQALLDFEWQVQGSASPGVTTRRQHRQNEVNNVNSEQVLGSPIRVVNDMMAKARIVPQEQEKKPRKASTQNSAAVKPLTSEKSAFIPFIPESILKSAPIPIPRKKAPVARPPEEDHFVGSPKRALGEDKKSPNWKKIKLIYNGNEFIINRNGPSPAH